MKTVRLSPASFSLDSTDGVDLMLPLPPSTDVVVYVMIFDTEGSIGWTGVFVSQYLCSFADLTCFTRSSRRRASSFILFLILRRRWLQEESRGIGGWERYREFEEQGKHLYCQWSIFYHVKVIHVLTQITSCDVVIVETFHDYIVGRRPSMTLLLEMRGRSQCMLLMQALERYFSIWLRSFG